MAASGAVALYHVEGMTPEAALEEGLVGRDERVVLLVTGSGLKDVPSAAHSVAIPEPVDPNLEAVMERLKIEV